MMMTPRHHRGYACTWRIDRSGYNGGDSLVFQITRQRDDGAPWEGAWTWNESFLCRDVVAATSWQALLGTKYNQGEHDLTYASRVRHLPKSAIAMLADTYPIARDWLIDQIGE